VHAVGGEQVVVQKVLDVLPAGVLQQGSGCEVRADVALVADDADAGVRGGGISQDGGGLVGRGVVADDDSMLRWVWPSAERSYLERVKQTFPDRVRLLLLRREGEPVAAAVVYRVLDDVDQVVHWGDAAQGLARSPMDLLAHLVFTGSLATGARFVDLGPSSEKDGTPNLGLSSFKRAVGAVPGARKVFVARLG
jgi:hypothetical protein